MHETNASVPAGDLPDALLGALDALGRDPELAVQQRPVAEELALPYLGDGALVTVYAKPESLSGNCTTDSITRCPAANERT